MWKMLVKRNYTKQNVFVLNKININYIFKTSKVTQETWTHY